MLDVWLFPQGITIYQASCTGVAGREITPIIICLSGGFPLQILMFPPLVLYGLVVVFTLIHHGDVFGQGDAKLWQETSHLRLFCDRFVFRDSLLKASKHTQALIERYQLCGSFKAH